MFWNYFLQVTGFKTDLKRYRSCFELWENHVYFCQVSLLLGLGPNPWEQNQKIPMESYFWSNLKAKLPTIFNAFNPVLYISDILLWIRIHTDLRIRIQILLLSVPDNQPTKNKFFNFKDKKSKTSHKKGEIKVFLTFFVCFWKDPDKYKYK